MIGWAMVRRDTHFLGGIWRTRDMARFEFDSLLRCNYSRENPETDYLNPKLWKIVKVEWTIVK